MKKLKEFLWTKDIFEIINKYIYSTESALISLRLYNFDIKEINYEEIVIGNLHSDVYGATISNWQTLDFGSVTVQEYWGMYLDYMSTTKCTLYLPYVGYVPISNSDVINCTLKVYYNIDLYSKTCVAIVKSINNRFNTEINVMQITTRIGMDIPLSSNTSNLVPDLIGTGISIATMNPVSTLTNAVGVATAQDSIVNQSLASDASGLLGYSEAYIIIERTQASVPSTYLSEQGYPLMASMRIDKCKGFTKIYDCKLDIPDASAEEKEQLLALLKDGIIL